MKNKMIEMKDVLRLVKLMGIIKKNRIMKRKANIFRIRS